MKNISSRFILFIFQIFFYGNFIITWSGYIFSNEDLEDHRNIFAQRFDKDGNKVGEEFQINDKTDTGYSEVAMDDAGNFVVTWGVSEDVYARMYDSDGNPLGDEFKVPSTERVDSTPPCGPGRSPCLGPYTPSDLSHSAESLWRLPAEEEPVWDVP